MQKLDLTPKKAERFAAIDLIRFVDKFLTAGATHHMIQDIAIYDNKEQQILLQRIMDAWNEPNPFAICTNAKKQWESIYRYYFDRTGDQQKAISEINLPEHYPNEQAIIVGKGTNIFEVLTVCRQHFEIKCNDYYFDAITNFRETYHNDYCVTVKKIVNACEDKSFQNKSLRDLQREGHLGITLIERLLLELHYFLTTGRHLDTMKWSATMCSGSYFKDNGVPRVTCANGVVEIDCIAPDVVIKGNNDCSREVTVH